MTYVPPAIENGLTDQERIGGYYATVEPGVLSFRDQYQWYPSTVQASRHGVMLPRSPRYVVKRTYPHLPLPRWVKPVNEAFLGLFDLKENWDSYGAKPINARAAERALDLLISIMGTETPAPSVVPTVAGGIQFEWHLRGMDMEIEVAPTGEPVFGFEGESEEIEGRLPGDSMKLAGLISRLSG